MLTCLITGANRGIGLELARHYAANGATVLATARDPAAALELKKLKVEILPLDVTDTAAFDRLAATLKGRAIDRLIANAGVMGPRGGLADPANTAEGWAHVLAVNVSGVYFTVRAFADNVALAKNGKIAILSSKMGSSTAAAGSAYLYRTSKAAAANLGANFATELKPKGIAVGVYHPGWVKTDMGGSGADISSAVSASGLAARIEHLSTDTSGVFEDYAGAAITY
jgi:NAD(P)-dependent dehydrogenase (short-subunit alcohol dehydrogenase family)